MFEVKRLLGQGVVYVVAAAVTGYLASRPVYHQVPADMAQIKMSLSHGAARVTECRRLTSQEIAKLPAAERRPNTCDRQRVPIRVQLVVDDAVIYDEELVPIGLSRDGPARMYQKFLVPAGQHRVTARLRDSRKAEGFDYETTHQVDLSPWQNLAIDFRPDSGSFLFR
jgi:hypothetical protein